MLSVVVLRFVVTVTQIQKCKFQNTLFGKGRRFETKWQVTWTGNKMPTQ